MENEDTQFENLENLTNDELEALESTQDNTEDEESEPTIDYKAKAEAAERRAATLQRLLNKKGEKTYKKPDNELEKDIADIKFQNKVLRFCEENSLTRIQAEQVLKLYPNATAETLKDPFVAAGVKSLAARERVANNTPGAKGSASTLNSKKLSEMTEDEKNAWYTSA